MKNLFAAIMGIALILSNISAVAQPKGDEQSLTLQLRSNLQKFFGQHDLGFSFKYTYALESKPAIILDTLEGSYRKSGKMFRYSIGSTETICDSMVMVTAFHDESLLYLNMPVASDLVSSLVNVFDELEKGQLKYTVRLEHIGESVKYELTFSQPSPYKLIEYIWNRRNNSCSSIKMVIETELSQPELTKEELNALDKWSIVVFSVADVTSSRNPPETFSTGKYVQKVSDKYLAIPSYKHYQLFKANPNL